MDSNNCAKWRTVEICSGRPRWPIPMIHHDSVFSSVGVNFRPLAIDSLQHVVPLTQVLNVERGYIIRLGCCIS